MNHMDASNLKNKSAHRRTNKVIIGFKCQYCNKSFVHEKRFMDHKCKEKRNLDLVKTTIGQAAFFNYNSWMEFSGKSQQKVDTFIQSRYFVTFYKFTEYCKKLKIDSIQFIRLLTKKYPDIKPTIWTSSDVYRLYLKDYDDHHDPIEQVMNSLEFVIKQSEHYECHLDKTLIEMGFNKVIESIRLKKISPWFLYTHVSGTNFIRSLHKDEYQLLEQIIDSAAWAARFSENRNLLEEIQHLVNL